MHRAYSVRRTEREENARKFFPIKRSGAGKGVKRGMEKDFQPINARGARAAGILLHISSLPGKYGIGTLGKEAYAFVDFLQRASVKYWQVLPLVQTGFGDSPYQSVFSNSGNPYFIDPEKLHADGLLTDFELNRATMPAKSVNYAKLYQKRYPVLRKAFSRFDKENEKFRSFVEKGEFRAYAEFMAIKKKFGGRSFAEWDKKFKFNDRRTVEEYIAANEEEYLFWQWLQFEFFEEWHALRKYANERGISLIGDIPLYVAYDSADVWSMPELFKLDKNRAMTEVAGCPPDYFSAEGQLWGNPLYDWERHKRSGYAWWINRLRAAFDAFDVVRVDHFRGLDRYYAIPAGNKNAVIGRWCDGPKSALFKAAEKRLGKLNIIAEDLGVMDDGVRKLLKDTAFPGMKILLFAFEGGENDYLPKNIGHNSVCYTGTHDNDTAVGYLKRQNPSFLGYVKNNIRAALKSRNLSHALRGYKDTADALLHLLFECDACLAVAPVQDLLFLDNSARMNTPSTNEVNWRFRLKMLPTEADAMRLKGLLTTYRRI